ncbi:MAG: efflux RND transporter permease subunit [Candidatus Hydrogenedentes bacterium]|nr:efflux RND transporter permease subunit [Candidatus Hydrogenedentota bacterium]
MSMSSLFIQRPVMTTLVMVGIMLLGVAGYRAMPVSDLPNVDFPTLSISANLPGASPETMASSVATPLERQFSTIAGISSMTSTNALGSSQITLQFDLERDIDAAAQDVQSAIMQSLRQLPRDMPNPPSLRKVNPADQPILYLALSSPVLPLSMVDEYAQTMVSQRISMLPGVAQVQVYGSQKYAVRVQVDPHKLAARGIGVDEVSMAIQQANVNLPTGTLQGEFQAYTIETSGELMSAKAYEPIIVTWRDGAPVYLRDLGRVIDSVENNRAASWFSGTRGVVLAVQRQPGTNTIAIVDAIKKLVPEFRTVLPPAVSLDILYDRSQAIRASVEDVQFTFLLTVALVVMVIFLFLRNLVATIIPTLALILSIVGSFAAMYLLDFSIDNLSLMALTLSVGFVVDDAIVMIENIVRHMEKGESPMEAAYKGSREIGFTILSMTVSLVAVFIPVLFLGGIVGRLLHEFAITISVAILISGFVSLSLTPMLCSRFLRDYEHTQHGMLYNTLERLFEGMLALYAWTLRLSLRFRLLTVLSLIPLIYFTGMMFSNMPKGFMPSEDLNQLVAITEGAQGISFEDMKNHQQKLAAIVAGDPNVSVFMSAVGAGGPNASGNAGRMFITLKPRNERADIDTVMQGLRKKFAAVPGIRVFLQNRPAINVGGQTSKSLYQFTLQGMDTEQLYAYTPELESRLRGLPGFRDVSSDLQISNPQVHMAVDREKAASLGISMQQVQDALYTAYGTRQVSTIFAPNNQYNVILEVLPELQMDPAAIELLYVRSSDGMLAPLSTISSIEKTVGPLTVNHLGQFPAVTISFNLEPGYSLGDAVTQVNKAAAEILPATISTSFQGTAQAFESSMAGLNILILAAIIVIYIVLGILYESFIHPITILSGLPSAGVGALVTLWLFNMDLNLFSLVGLILLIGIVKKNAIMMVDFALEAQRERGVAPAEAIYDACIVRFRPIMMTTMAALMGTLPIALGHGAGAESRQPLGLAVVGGLLFSQVLTLYVTPCVYIYMEQLQQYLKNVRGKSGSAAAAKPEQDAQPV